MKASRYSFLTLGSAALLAAVISVLPQSSDACGDKDSACACGAACPSQQEGAAPGACACGGAAAAAGTGQGAAVEGGGCAHAAAMAGGGAGLRAVIDPATGQFGAPAAGAVPTGDIPPATTRSAETAQQVAQPGGGVMAAVPLDRAPKAMATVDGEGNVHTGCSE